MSDEAAHWYKNELDLNEESYLRFHVHYGGVGGNVPGFSLGIAIEEPSHMHTSVKIGQTVFYIEESDVWYFENKNLIITLDEQLNEPQITYESA